MFTVGFIVWRNISSFKHRMRTLKRSVITRLCLVAKKLGLVGTSHKNKSSALCFNKWDQDARLWIHFLLWEGMGLYHLSMAKWYQRNYPWICGWYVDIHRESTFLPTFLTYILKDIRARRQKLILTDPYKQTWGWTFGSHLLSHPPPALFLLASDKERWAGLRYSALRCDFSQATVQHVLNVLWGWMPEGKGWPSASH